MVVVVSAPPRTGRYNRKNPRPSEAMHSPDGTHYRCAWIEDSITVHSDGNVSCGLDDPHGQRSFGNINTQSVAEIFANPEYRALQERLWRGRRCNDCGHFRAETAPDARIAARPALPSRLVIETTVTCNIRCPNLPCLANNDAQETTRDGDFLAPGAFNALIDQVAPGLRTVNFYNYGEPFMNRRAEDMLLYLREKCPAAFIVTSTNGIPLSKRSRAEQLVRAAPNRITFTIGGVRQESYERYHVRGQVAQALAGLRNVCEAKRAMGQTMPQVVWRYLCFHWNDTHGEIDEAIALAKEIGVDRFSLYLTNTPPRARSVRLSPGSPSFWKYSRYIHLDDEGELNHAYPCALPDQDGWFAPGSLPTLGRGRWTSSRARLRVAGRGGVLRLALGTNRSHSDGETCVVHTPWKQFRFEAPRLAWNEVEIPVPARFWQHDAFEVEIVADDPWYPAFEGSIKDLRCLGVFVRCDDTVAEPENCKLLPYMRDPMLRRYGAAEDADTNFLHVLPQVREGVGA